jgi:ABC-type multidrug transport system fused ATPase/permease subunit
VSIQSYFRSDSRSAAHYDSQGFSMLIKLCAVVIVTPIFILPGIVITTVEGWLGRVYIKAQLSVKREMANAKSPVLGHFGAAIAGLTSIRAYGAQAWYSAEALKRSNHLIRPSRTFYNLNRWVTIRIDLFNNLFCTCLAVYLVYGRHHMSASTVGFALNMVSIPHYLLLAFAHLKHSRPVSALYKNLA